MIQASDIVYVYSGGIINSDPQKSIGGDPSQFTIAEGVNTVFSDISVNQSKTGYLDYRCIYVFNNSTTDSFYNVQVYFQTLLTGGSNMLMGLPTATDVQRIIITGSPQASNTYDIVYDWGNPTQQSVTILYDINQSVGQHAQVIQDALNNLPVQVLSGVEVEGQYIPAGVNPVQNPAVRNFTIKFLGTDNNKNQPLLHIANMLLGFNVTVVVNKLYAGGPINTIASPLSFDTIAPAGVDFSLPTEESPITLGILKATEGFPIWLRRETPANANSVQNDGFSLAIIGSPF